MKLPTSVLRPLIAATAIVAVAGCGHASVEAAHITPDDPSIDQAARRHCSRRQYHLRQPAQPWPDPAADTLVRVSKARRVASTLRRAPQPNSQCTNGDRPFEWPWASPLSYLEHDSSH